MTNKTTSIEEVKVDTLPDEYKFMTNYTLVIPYQQPISDVDDETGEVDTVYEQKLKKFNHKETTELTNLLTAVKAFLMVDCEFPESEIPDTELAGLVMNFGMWDEKIVTLGKGNDAERLPFLKANAKATKLAYEVKREELLKGLEEDGKSTGSKGIEFNEAENASGRERVLQLMSASLQSL